MNADERSDKRPRRLKTDRRTPQGGRLQKVAKILTHRTPQIAQPELLNRTVQMRLHPRRKIIRSRHTGHQTTRRRPATVHIAVDACGLPAPHLRRHQIENIPKNARIVVTQFLKMAVSKNTQETGIMKPYPATAVDDNVRQRNVAMRHVLPVNVPHRPEQLQQHLRHILLAQRNAEFEHIAKRSPRNIRMRTVKNAGLVPAVIRHGNRPAGKRHRQLQHIIQTRRPPRIAQHRFRKTSQTVRISALFGTIHCAQPVLANLFLQIIAIQRLTDRHRIFRQNLKLHAMKWAKANGIIERRQANWTSSHGFSSFQKFRKLQNQSGTPTTTPCELPILIHVA